LKNQENSGGIANIYKMQISTLITGSAIGILNSDRFCIVLVLTLFILLCFLIFFNEQKRNQIIKLKTKLILMENGKYNKKSN